MKFLVFLGVALLIACAQVNGQGQSQSPAESFLENYKNLTDSWLSSQQNPSKFDILKIKIDALLEVSWRSGVGMRAYKSIVDVLLNLRQVASDMRTPERVVDIIGNRLEDFDSMFDRLNMQRDVDESDLPSKINDLVDEFVKRYTETLVELFDTMLTQSKHLGDGAEKPTEESIAMVDAFAENIQKCLTVPITEFKEISQCRQNTRVVVLPTLAHNSAMLNIIAHDLQQLESLQLDGKTSIYQLFYDMRSESSKLYKQIQKVRDQREAEKDNKTAESNK